MNAPEAMTDDEVVARLAQLPDPGMGTPSGIAFGVLRQLAGSVRPLTARELTDRMTGWGRRGGTPTVQAVKTVLSRMERNAGRLGRPQSPLVHRVDVERDGSIVWDITPHGATVLAETAAHLAARARLRDLRGAVALTRGE